MRLSYLDLELGVAGYSHVSGVAALHNAKLSGQVDEGIQEGVKLHPRQPESETEVGSRPKPDVLQIPIDVSREIE